MAAATVLERVGNDSMDRDHTRLIELARELDDALLSSGGGSTAEELFRELHRNMREHFEAEECEMRENGFPDAERHIREHQEALAWLEHLEQRMLQSSSVSHALADAPGVLRTWIHEHLPQYDRPLSDFLGCLRVGGDAGP
jgi:hemerythrin-like metal-binding protein